MNTMMPGLKHSRIKTILFVRNLVISWKQWRIRTKVIVKKPQKQKQILKRKSRYSNQRNSQEFLLSQIEAESDDFEATIKKLDSSWRFEGQQSYGLQVRLKRNN